MRGLEDSLLKPGTGFPLVRALSKLSREPHEGGPLIDVRVMSKNSPETGLAVSNSAKHYELEISRFIFTGGEPLADYAKALNLDLYLSTNRQDVQKVVDSGACAAALLSPPPKSQDLSETQLRLAFDGDAVLFSEESEALYKEKGIRAFFQKETELQDSPMSPGPFYEFLKKLAQLQERLPTQLEYNNVRIAIVTARNAPADKRVLTTLREWGIYVDAAFFLGGLPKSPILKAFNPHIFFDDQSVHIDPASEFVPSGLVLYKSDSPLAGQNADAQPDPDEAKGERRLSVSPADIEPR